MLRLIDVAVARGARTLYRGISLVGAPRERIGLVGANGCGKSSLFAAILGELPLDAGRLEIPPPERIAHVAQEIADSDAVAIDYVLDGHAPLMKARAELAAAHAGADEWALAQAHAHLAELNEGAVVAAAHAVLAGLGFAPGDAARPLRDFSGGWRNRLALGRALMRPADLLLLDEPTNHLDLDSVIWLEAWLRRQPATVVVISHDREFLDRATEVTWHVADGTIRRFAGGYSTFELAWLERQRQQDAAARQYQRTAAHLTSFVERFRAKATKARQAQSRLKMLERLQAVEPVRATRQWRFEFPAPRRLPERLVDGEGLAFGYDGCHVLGQVDFTVRSGDRIGVLGVNGAGKSTLIRGVIGELPPLGGEIRPGAGLAVGYFAQHQMDQLRPDESPLQHLRRLAPEAREQELRDFLGQFQFAGELAMRETGPMSGGEKARCALALIAWLRPNLLVLDEPTNHLDMETREALTVALSAFEGALLLVSHDRHLLRAATDQLWLVAGGTMAPYDGDLDDYAALVLANRREREAAEAPGSGSRREQRRQQAEVRQRHAAQRKPLLNRLRQTEADLASASAALKDIDSRLADPAFYHEGDPAEVAALMRRRSEIGDRVEQLELRWLELSAELEGFDSPGGA